MQSHWLRAFASVAQGGAGGPNTEYLQVVRGREVVAQALCQTLSVADMQLGARVRPGLVAVAIGATAYQLGQSLFSGEYGAVASPGEDLGATLAAVSRALEREGTWFMKDIGGAARLGDSEWTTLEALPEMTMPIREAWRTFDDYLAALPSKYRTRARRARGKLGRIAVRALSTAEVARYGEEIQSLYDGLMGRTSYAPFVVAPGYVTRLKASLPEQVTVLGFFDEREVVGFATLFLEGREGLAHLAAVDEGYNAGHQLYLNMLFALLEEAIAQGCGSLNFGRTATTIKSSLGAVPHYYRSYVRHTGCVRNQLIRQLVERVLDPADAGALVQRPLE